jgi:hypothetical protein
VMVWAAVLTVSIVAMARMVAGIFTRTSSTIC